VQLVQAWVPTGLASYGVPALLFARLGSVAQPVPSGDVYVLDYYEEVLRGCVDKMAVQIGPFPGVSRSLAYIPEALSIALRFWKMSSPA
jgi:hypothetical protein